MIMSFSYTVSAYVGRVDTGGHIHMTTRDMAKIGQLFLQHGLWNEQCLISKQWVNESTVPQILTNKGYHYRAIAFKSY